jgi:dTDP-glucose 4,6-dehydratase
LIRSDYHSPVNIGNPVEFTILELAETILRLTGSRSEIVYEALPQDDPTIRQPDIMLATALLGWEPTIQLEQGLRMTIDGLAAAPSHPTGHAGTTIA